MARANAKLIRSHVLALLAACACCVIFSISGYVSKLVKVDLLRAASSSKNVARVCTYYSHVFGNSSQAEAFAKLLQLWQQSWASQGWDTKVLTEADAAKHPRYSEWIKPLSRLPTVNVPAYELSCYLRWVAALQSGCGWLVDIDVINYGFPPQRPYAGPVLYVFDGHVPSIVTGQPAAFEAMVEAFVHSYHNFANGIPDVSIQTFGGRPHTSDMFIIMSRPDLYMPLGYPLSLKNPRARNASLLLHFSEIDVREALGLSNKAQAVMQMRPLPAKA